ncbi:hypothetical protein C8J56DRAFT_1025913 [Mycena floridula]|nr:hypothetical protein C8J56DRAFT_1025913 [Mycena floridula]
MYLLVGQRGTSRNTGRKYIGASGRPARGSHAKHWTLEREEIHRDLRYFWHIFWTYKAWSSEQFRKRVVYSPIGQASSARGSSEHREINWQQYYSENGTLDDQENEILLLVHKYRHWRVIHLFETLREVGGAYNVPIISSKCRSDTERHQPKHQPVSWDNFKPFAFNQYPALFNDHISRFHATAQLNKAVKGQ